MRSTRLTLLAIALTMTACGGSRAYQATTTPDPTASSGDDDATSSDDDATSSDDDATSSDDDATSSDDAASSVATTDSAGTGWSCFVVTDKDGPLGSCERTASECQDSLAGWMKTSKPGQTFTSCQPQTTAYCYSEVDVSAIDDTPSLNCSTDLDGCSGVHKVAEAMADDPEYGAKPGSLTDCAATY